MYALILAGGRGERLRPLSDNVPKPMVPLCGKPILWYQVQFLKKAGVTDVVFLAGYRWEAIQEYFGDGSSHGIRVHYSVEDTPLGTGGAVREGMSLVPDEERAVVVTNGDIVTGEDLGRLVKCYAEKRASNTANLATVMVVPFVSPYGLVELGEGDTVKGFREKAVLPHWINGGIYVFSRDMQGLLPEEGQHETSTLPTLSSEGRLSAFRSNSFWRSVDSFKDLQQAEEYLQSQGH